MGGDGADHVGLVADVGGDALDLEALAAQLLVGGLELLRAAGDERHRVAALAEHPRDGEPDPARGAGHDRCSRCSPSALSNHVTRLASAPMARLLLSLLAAAVVLSACGRSDDDGGAAPAPPQPPAAAPADFPSATGKTLNELIADLPHGAILNVSSSKGQRPGRNRLGFAIVDRANKQIDVSAVAVYTAKPDGSQLRGPFAARKESLDVDTRYRSAQTDVRPRQRRHVLRRRRRLRLERPAHRDRPRAPRRPARRRRVRSARCRSARRTARRRSASARSRSTRRPAPTSAAT